MSQNTTNEQTTSSKSEDKIKNEQTFSILPHPAKTNDPADLNPRTEKGGGLSSQALAGIQAHHAKGPYVPSQDIVDNLPAPLSRDELDARAAELNR